MGLKKTPERPSRDFHMIQTFADMFASWAVTFIADGRMDEFMEWLNKNPELHEHVNIPDTEALLSGFRIFVEFARVRSQR